jgi:tetratricopeptide (TPR) repeat protein
MAPGPTGSAGSAEAEAPAAGKTFGPYLLLGELGRGAMGVVYKARHREKGDTVALKVLISGEFSSPKHLARFREEAATVQKLVEHPNIVPLRDSGEVGGVPYFTMKFIEGNLLEDLLERNAITMTRAAEAIRDIAQGAHHAHVHGIVHRDIKPANVMVETATSVAYLMDFGLAKDLDDSKGLSRSGVAVGTPLYMSPEQAQGRHRELDGRSDVYSLGAVLYRTLAGRVPFTAETSALLLKKIMEEEPVAPSSVREGVPASLEVIALKALRKRKEDRYPTAADFARDLKRALAGRDISARRESPLRLAARLVTRHPLAATLVVSATLATGSLVFGIRASATAAALTREREEREVVDRESAVRRMTLDLLAEGDARRLEARLARTPRDARALLGEALERLGKAAETGDPELRARAFYGRGLVRRRLLDPDCVADFRAALWSKAFEARAHLALGIHYLRDEHDAAAARVELGLARAPAGPAVPPDEVTAALLAQGYVALIGNDLVASQRALNDAERRAGDLVVDACDALAHVALESSFGDDGQVALADAEATRGLVLDRWHPALHATRGLARARGWNLAGALEDMQLAQEAGPDAAEPRVLGAWIAALSGRDADGRALLAAETRRAPPNAKPYFELCERRLRGAVYTVSVSEGALQRGAGFVDAGTTELWADLPPSCPADLSEVNDAVRRNHLADAQKRLATLVSSHGDTCGCRLLQARLLLAQGAVAEARGIVDATLKADPANVLALCLAALLDEARDAPKARALLERCLSTRPDLRTPRILCAELLDRAKLFVDAEALARPIFAADERNGEAGLALADALAGRARVDEATAVLERVVLAGPSNVRARLKLGSALRARRRYDEALACADAGLKNLPGNWLLELDGAVTFLFQQLNAEADDRAARAVKSATLDRTEALRLVEELRAFYPRR